MYDFRISFLISPKDSQEEFWRKMCDHFQTGLNRGLFVLHNPSSFPPRLFLLTYCQACAG